MFRPQLQRRRVVDPARRGDDEGYRARDRSEPRTVAQRGRGTLRTNQDDETSDAKIYDISSMRGGTKPEMQRVERNLMGYFSYGAVVSLTIGSIVVKEGRIARAVRQRSGCFMMTAAVGGKTTSCKVAELSCACRDSSGVVNVMESSSCRERSSSPKSHRNVALFLIRLAQLPESDPLKCKLCEKLGSAVIDPSALETLIERILNNEYDVVNDFVSKVHPQLCVDPCELSNRFVEGARSPRAECAARRRIRRARHSWIRRRTETTSLFNTSSTRRSDVIADVIYSTGKNILEADSAGADPSSFNSIYLVIPNRSDSEVVNSSPLLSSLSSLNLNLVMFVATVAVLTVALVALMFLSGRRATKSSSAETQSDRKYNRLSQ